MVTLRVVADVTLTGGEDFFWMLCGGRINATEGGRSGIDRLMVHTACPWDQTRGVLRVEFTPSAHDTAGRAKE